jgi:metallo-beta-lactamase class B
MKRVLKTVFGLGFVLVTASAITNAQTGSKAAAQTHINAAKTAAYEPGNDLTVLFDTICAAALSEKGPVEPAPQIAPSLAQRKAPPRSEWYTEPAKVFDNLYWFGSQEDSTWAVTTSQGIILIDTANEYTVKDLVIDGMKKMGLDPTQIKYIILSHPHGDRYYGSRYLQDTYHPRVIMSEADWATLEKSNEPNELKPKKDMVATDGMKVTLGDTTLTLYVTPGHTPGTISTIVPLKDGNQRHLGAVWGGIAPSFERYGVRYYSSLPETFKTWSASAGRFREIANKAGVDVYMTIHPYYDKALDKMHALNFRKPGGPHPFVSKDNFNRFMTIIKECTDAQLARISS